MGKVSTTNGVPFGIKLSAAEARVFRELLSERESGVWPTSDRRIASQAAIILAKGEKASQRELRTLVMLRKTLSGSAPTTVKDFRKETRSKEREAARRGLEAFFQATRGLLAQPANAECWEALIDHEISRRNRIGPLPDDKVEED